MKQLANAGLALVGALERIRLLIAPVTDRAIDRLTGPRISEAQAREAGMAPFEAQADAAMSQATTHRAQSLVRWSLVLTAALIVWAALAEVDEVTKGDAKVVPSRQLQVIQALDGGVVTDIRVKEGDVVEAGQLLLKIDETRATSGVMESAAQTFSLQAKLARLKALAEGATFAPPSPSTDEERNVVDEERNLYENRRYELSTQVGISQQQLAQRQQELSEVRARRESASRSLELSQQELSKTRPLLQTGAVSEVEVLRLERDVTRARGEVEQSGAQIARVQAAISEASRKIQETELSFRNEARKELSETLGRLNSLNQGAVALADKVDKASVKSPVRGRVQRLLANTVGGVVQPGRDIVEIVPLDDALMLEAKVAPKDIAFIHPGQAATVKFTAYDFSVYGGLEAVVDNISPDTETDERGQQTFYTVRVKTKATNFSEKMPIIPGMTAEVDILTGKKTVLSYLLKPVLKAKAYALRER
jgi:adhesin transport system membrane fusion protein